MAFGEHRCDDAVPALQVGRELAQQVRGVAAYPQMMMRIDDRQVGFEDRLLDAFEPDLVLAAAIVEPVGHRQPSRAIARTLARAITSRAPLSR